MTSPLEIILVAGPPASGKSTLATQLAIEMEAPLINGDYMHKKIFELIKPFVVEDFEKFFIDATLNKIEITTSPIIIDGVQQSLEKGDPSTFNNIESIQNFISIIEDGKHVLGINRETIFHIIWCDTPIKTCYIYNAVKQYKHSADYIKKFYYNIISLEKYFPDNVKVTYMSELSQYKDDPMFIEQRKARAEALRKIEEERNKKLIQTKTKENMIAQFIQKYTCQFQNNDIVLINNSFLFNCFAPAHSLEEYDLVTPEPFILSTTFSNYKDILKLIPTFIKKAKVPMSVLNFKIYQLVKDPNNIDPIYLQVCEQYNIQSESIIDRTSLKYNSLNITVIPIIF